MASEVAESGPHVVVALRQLLDGEHATQRQHVRDALRDPRFAYVDDDVPTDDYRELVLEWLRALTKDGVGGGGSFPRRYGGEDDPGGRIAMFETLAFGDLSLLVKCGVQFGLFGGSVHRLGTERHHEAYLRDIATLDLPGCFAMSESGHGSDVQRLRTRAVYDPATQEFVVTTPDDDARKDWIGNAARHGRMAVVFAQLEVAGTGHGVHAFLVPLRNTNGELLPGIRVEDCGPKMGLNGVDNGRIWFDDVRIPRDALLNRFADVSPEGDYSSPIESDGRRFFTMIGALVQGRVSIGAAALSVSKSALTIAVRYGDRRRQFGADGEPEMLLLDYLTHQRRLLPLLARSFATDFAVKKLVADFVRSVSDPDHDEKDQRALEAYAAGLKAYSTRHATDAVQACREACGGQGYLSVNRFASLKNDSDVFTTFEGDNTVLLQLVAKALLSDYSQQFEDMNVLEMFRHLTSRTTTRLTELNPLSRLRANDDEDHLRGSEFQLETLKWREDHMLDGLARRLRSALGTEGVDPMEALIACQDHAVATATAHIERVVYEEFAAVVDAVDGPQRAVLDRLRDLFAVDRIVADRGWFLEHGYLSGGQTKALQLQLNELCRELRPDAGMLVDAFGIPDELLAAPIGVSAPAGARPVG